MKLVQSITGCPCFGGAEAHVRDLTIGLISLGNNCCVIVSSPGGLFHGQLQAMGVPVIVIPPLQKALHPFRDLESPSSPRSSAVSSQTFWLPTLLRQASSVASRQAHLRMDRARIRVIHNGIRIAHRSVAGRRPGLP